MAPRLCLALAWLAACALIGPATPVAEGPEPPAAATGPALDAGETESEEEHPVPAEPEQSAPEVASPPEPAASGDETIAATPAQPPAEAAPPAAEASPQPPRGAPVAFAAAAGAVTIEDFSFGPASVTVGVGETVTWRNAGPSEHTATATDGSFDTGLLAQGESATKEFATAGTFSYVCTPHPFMKGTVRVVAQAAGEAPQDGAQPAAGTAPSGGAETAATGGELPRTGADAGWLLVTGIGLVLIGSAGRRRDRQAAV